MEKSERVSKIPTSFAQGSNPFRNQGMLPFSGLGFDLRPVLTRRIRVRVVSREETLFEETPLFDCVLPSGRWLQVRLGREIRGR